MAHTSSSDSVPESLERDSVPSRDPFLHPQLDQLQGWTDAPNDKCYSSFGDCGTTATVNAYGNIIQFSTPIEKIESGIAVADHARVPEPYRVELRTSEILKLSEEKFYNEKTFGFRLDDELIADSSPSLTYVNYRWPRFEYSKNREGVSTTIQWVVSDHTVLQQCTFKNDGANKYSANIRFTQDMLIRDVDYLERRHGFNDSIKGYMNARGSNNSSWVKVHQLDGENLGYVAVVVSLFLNGEKLQWGDDLSWDLNVESNQSAQIVFAYKMLHTPATQIWSELSIPHEVTKVGKILSDESFSNTFRLLTSTSSHTPKSGAPLIPTMERLEYLLRRNLEHILSVCAIPTSVPEKARNDAERRRLGVPIVLTCGDVSFHRVNTAASFFALQFLIEFAKQISSTPEDGKYDEYAKRLVERIQLVCEGHLCWLLYAEKTSASDRASNLFAANYWVRGRIMKKNNKDSRSWIPNDSTTDTAFQLIKIKACLDFLGRSQADFQPTIGEITRGWLNDLERKQPQGAYVWPHCQKADTKFYRLDDNVWIWKALKDIELGQFLPAATNLSLNEVPKLEKKGAYRDVQQAILRRFTTEHSILRQRMLAVSRSSRDTRFLFHARDTVLFYARDWNFISSDTDFAEVWKNTIDVQKYHEDNQEIRWDNALRYALSISMACDGFSINRRSTADIIKGSLHVLIDSSSPNGLMMGQLDETSKKPIQFVKEGDRDFYFHAGFEIPFILLTKATEIMGFLNRQSRNTMPDKKSGASTEWGTATAFPQSTPQSTLYFSITNGDGELLFLGAGPNDGVVANTVQKVQSGSSKLRRPMKKTLPFNDWVESRSVVEMDDEWLFNRPSFFSEGDDNDSNVCTDINQVLDDIKDIRLSLSATIEQAAAEWREKQTRGFPSEPANVAAERVTMVDIAKKNKTKGKNIRPNDGDAYSAVALSNSELWKCLEKPRKAKSAKKRFVWLRDPNRETALMSFAGSPQNEYIPMSDFFKLHTQGDQSFSEETTMYLNTWETEIHLSFYQLVNSDSGSDSRSDDLTNSIKEELPGLKEKLYVRKASTGFRFVGDFFDRYWTCHFIEYFPSSAKCSDISVDNASENPSQNHSENRSENCSENRSENRSENHSDNRSDNHSDNGSENRSENQETEYWDFNFKPSSEDRSWTQRKILELHLFERMLTRLVESTGEIFHTFQKEFKDPSAEFAPMGLDELNYFQSSLKWQETQNSLKVIADHLEHTDDIIKRWESREKDRASEQPRWTRYDEGQFRRSINKLRVSTNNMIREFRALHSRINSFRESLITRQDQTRNEIDVRGSENIRFFTYVTVVFLPLGFASSIFSMSDVPDHALVNNLITFALEAIILTVLAVMSAKRVLGGFAKITDPIRQKARAEFGGFSFLILYIIIEIPAQRVSLALETLRAQSISLSGIINVIVGVFALPWWIITFWVQFIALNAADLADFAWTTMLRLCKPTSQSFVAQWGKEPARRSAGQARDTDPEGGEKIGDGRHGRYMKILITPVPGLRLFYDSKMKAKARINERTAGDNSSSAG